MTEAIRAFLAINVPAEAKKQIVEFQQELPCSWAKVNAEQLHITLAFMGKLPLESMDDVFTCAERTAVKFSPFNIKISDIGAFPDKQKPRILYASIISDELVDMAGELKKSLRDFTDMRPFKAHLTIARARRGQSAPFINEKFDYSWNVNEFTLYKSVLSRYGAIHSAVKMFSMKNRSF